LNKLINFLKKIFSKKEKQSIYPKGLSEKQLDELFLKHPELKQKSIILGDMHVLEKLKNE
jgi:hypothetical protein